MTSDHRIYPGRLIKPPRGICRWCGLLIRKEDGSVNFKKTFCGTICTTHYLLRADPRRMREHIFFRDNGICSACGTKHFYLKGAWEADHILPLFVSLGDPKFWEPDNLTLLCKSPCHKAKTKSDGLKYRKRDRMGLKMRYLDLEAME